MPQCLYGFKKGNQDMMSNKFFFGVGVLAVACLLGGCGGDDKSTATTTDTPKTSSESAAAKPSDTAADKTAAKGAAQETQAPNQQTTADNADSAPSQSPADEAANAAPAQNTAITDDMRAAKAALAADAGKVRYETSCSICHDKGLLDAPKPSDKANWAARTAQGVDTLYLHSIKGFNKMPAQAVNGVSEAEVMAAVDYLLKQAS